MRNWEKLLRFLLRCLLPTGEDKNSLLPCPAGRDNKVGQIEPENMMAKRQAEQQLRESQIQLETNEKLLNCDYTSKNKKKSSVIGSKSKNSKTIERKQRPTKNKDFWNLSWPKKAQEHLDKWQMR